MSSRGSFALEQWFSFGTGCVPPVLAYRNPATKYSLLLETSQAFGIAHRADSQYFDGDFASQPWVAGAVDFAHTPSPEGGDDFVRTEV